MTNLDYFGVRPECGCVTAWLSDNHATGKEVREFCEEMAASGREVQRMELTDELRMRIDRCPHREREEAAA